MRGYVYYQSGLSAKELTSLMERLGGLEYVIQETAVRIRFISFSEMDTLWDSGRAFGQSLEVRWRADGDAYYVQVLSEAPVEKLTEEGWPEPLVMTAERIDEVWLWGRHWQWLEGAKDMMDHLPDAWIQAGIPGRETLAYPLDPPREFAYLEVVDYQRDGVTLLTRFRGLGGNNREAGGEE